MTEATPIDGAGFRELSESLRAFVRRRVRDPQAAEDLVQDVLARLVREQAAGDGPRRIGAWLLRAARNAIVDRYRRSAREIPAGDLVDASSAAAPEPDDLAGLRASVRTFVHALPDPYREALLLTEFEGLSQRELADHLGVPLSTAKSRVQRARARFAAALHDCCTFELDRRGGVVDYRRRETRDPNCC